MAATKSQSIPQPHLIEHEAGDTFMRVFLFKNKNTLIPYDLTGTTAQFIVSKTKDGEPLATLTNGSGIDYTNAVNGLLKVFWQTGEILKANRTNPYWYKLKLTLANGVVKTYVEDQFKAT